MHVVSLFRPRHILVPTVLQLHLLMKLFYIRDVTLAVAKPSSHHKLLLNEESLSRLL